MTVEDLEHIFQDQLAHDYPWVFCMIADSASKRDIKLQVIKHARADLAGLLPMLDSFRYAGLSSKMPRFER